METVKAYYNYKKGRRGGLITHLVIHTMSGSYAGTIAWFQNPKSQVSAHYCLSKKGDLTQMVADEDTAWHVCNANPFCIGIECEDLTFTRDSTGKTKELTAANDPNWYTPSQLEALSTLVAQLMQKHNIPMTNVIGHNDPFLKQFGNNHSDPGPWFPWPKFRAMVQQKLEQK